jgi:uncharacterized protein with FMN-binding domain
MRRAPIVLAATVLGTAGVLLFKPLDVASIAGAGTSTAGGSSTSSGSGGGVSSSVPSNSTDGDDDGASDTASGTSGSSGSSTASGGSSSSNGSSAAQDGSFTGDAETTRFGTTQVTVTIAGGRITDVQPVQLNQNDPRSLQISQSAAPLLRTEVLSQQTAAVDTISGATYTSAAYEASLQSALDQAGYTAPDGSTASTSVSGFGR